MFGFKVWVQGSGCLLERETWRAYSKKLAQSHVYQVMCILTHSDNILAGVVRPQVATEWYRPLLILQYCLFFLEPS